jgi:type II secretory pathway pseudopilin PulG
MHDQDFSSNQSYLGFALVEVLLSLVLISSSYLVILTSQQWLSASALRQERNLKEMLLISDQHEIMLAHLFHDAE